MTQAENLLLREFSRKMRDEGTAGFADGPWDETEMEGDNELSARQRQQRNWTMKAARTRRPRTIGDRVLTWMAILALITLVAGIAGAWLSYQPEPEITVLDPDSLNKTPTLERVESRLTRMEKRLSHILDPYIRSLNNLNSKLDDTQQQLIEHIRNPELQQATTATGFAVRLEEVEQRLATTDERMDALSIMLVALADGKPAPRTAAPTVGRVSPKGVTRHAETPEPVMAAPKPAAEIPEPVIAAPEPAAKTPAPVMATPEPAAETSAPVMAAPESAVTVGRVSPKGVTPAPSMTRTAAMPAPVIRPEPTAPVAAKTAPGTVKGNWVINIASYTNENIARRKLTQMQQQGVDVELVTARVNGKTIYRARVFGFASRRDASAASTEIKSKLGLEEIWITKR
jgi:DedD protein